MFVRQVTSHEIRCTAAVPFLERTPKGMLDSLLFPMNLVHWESGYMRRLRYSCCQSCHGHGELELAVRVTRNAYCAQIGPTETKEHEHEIGELGAEHGHLRSSP